MIFYFRSDQGRGRSRYQPFLGHDNQFWGQFRGRGLGLGQGSQTSVPSVTRRLYPSSHSNIQQVNTNSQIQVSRQKKIERNDICSCKISNKIQKFKLLMGWWEIFTLLFCYFMVWNYFFLVCRIKQLRNTCKLHNKTFIRRNQGTTIQDIVFVFI